MASPYAEEHNQFFLQCSIFKASKNTPKTIGYEMDCLPLRDQLMVSGHTGT